MPRHGGTAGNSSRQIGSYELLNTLGSGGLAKVYRGRHIWLQREAAIKVLFDSVDQEKAEAFLREAWTIAYLRHPNIVRVLDFNVENNIPFLVMDIASGGSLQEYLRGRMPLPLDTVVSYVKQVASALQYAHDNKVIHRDVKLANMLLDQDGNILLSDFGIALNIQTADTQTIHNAIGTVLYMAPEQIEGHPTEASDQYSTAIAAYQMLAGTPPFVGTKKEVIAQHLHSPRPSIHRRNPNVPIAVARVLLKALNKNPKQRYPSITAFADALERASRQTTRPRGVSPIGARPSTPRPHRRTGRSFTPIAIFMLFLVMFSAAVGIVANTYPATVTITPQSVRLMKNYTLSMMQNDPHHRQVSERSITATSPPHSRMVKATGMGHTQATEATGQLTFYNGSSIPQKVAGNTRLVTHDGIVIVTDGEADMKAANPPNSFGMATVNAHALIVGTSGNIAPHSIDQACCVSDGSITVKNIAAFIGGQNSQTYPFVQQSDIDSAATPLLNAATTDAQTLLSELVHSNETFYSQLVQCKHETFSHPSANEIAAKTTITVRVTCTGNVYDRVGAISRADTQFITDSLSQLGANYALEEEPKTDLVKAVSIDITRGIIVLLLKIEGLWIFQFTNARRQALVRQIIGKSDKQASIWLLKQDGVAGISIQIPWWVPWIIRDALPADVHRIALIVTHH